jgi:hypothetical protein
MPERLLSWRSCSCVLEAKRNWSADLSLSLTHSRTHISLDMEDTLPLLAVCSLSQRNLLRLHLRQAGSHSRRALRPVLLLRTWRGPSLVLRATGLVKQLFLSKRLKRLSTFEPLYGLLFVGLAHLTRNQSTPVSKTGLRSLLMWVLRTVADVLRLFIKCQ